MDEERGPRRIVKDGNGYGVRQYSSYYNDWEFLNDEPLPSVMAAYAWLESFDGGEETDWEALRVGWSRGTLA